MNKKQYFIKGFPYHIIENMIYHPTIPNRLRKISEIDFGESNHSRVFFADIYDYMVYSVDIQGNELLSVPKEGNYLLNPKFEDAEMYCINRSYEHIFMH